MSKDLRFVLGAALSICLLGGLFASSLDWNLGWHGTTDDGKDLCIGLINTCD